MTVTLPAGPGGPPLSPWHQPPCNGLLRCSSQPPLEPLLGGSLADKLFFFRTSGDFLRGLK